MASFDLFLRRLAVFDSWLPPRASYRTYACGRGFVTTFLTVPLVKRLAIKLDAVDYPSKRRINTKPIPRMGGTAVFLGLVIACIVQIVGTWYLGWPPVLVPHPRLHISYPVLALSFTVIFATGAIDDVFQLKPKQKLAGQVLAALIACMGGLRIGVIVNPFAPGEIMLGWLAYPITVIYLVAFTNIINLIDGLDGLATGICGIASFTMFTMAMLWAVSMPPRSPSRSLARAWLFCITTSTPRASSWATRGRCCWASLWDPSRYST